MKKCYFRRRPFWLERNGNGFSVNIPIINICLNSDIFTNWKQWVLGPTKVEKYGSSVEFMGPLP